MIQRKRHLQALRTECALSEHPAGIVDQDVNPITPAGDGLGQPPHLVLVGKVGLQKFDIVFTAGQSYQALRRLATVCVAAHDHDMRAGFNQSAGGHQAYATGAPRDHTEFIAKFFSCHHAHPSVLGVSIMKPSHQRLLEGVAIAALVLGVQFAAGRNLPAGAPPPLAGQTLDGQPFDLARLRAQPAVIYFWGSWCPICRSMQGSIAAIAKDHPLVSVAMQSGSRAELLKYMQEQNVHVSTLPDEDGSISSRYGLRGVPAVFVLGPDGTIRYATTGYTSEIGIRFRLWLAAR
jgi:peroxiredoxin